MRGHRLAVIVALSALLGGCAWFESLFGTESDDTAAVEAPPTADAPRALVEWSSKGEVESAAASSPAAAPQVALLPGYLADFETGLNLGGGLDTAPRHAPEVRPTPAVSWPPVPARRPDGGSASAIVPAALTVDAAAREVDFAAGARLAGTPLSQVIRTSATPSLTPLVVPLGEESYSLADALRDAKWRRETARRLETMFR